MSNKKSLTLLTAFAAIYHQEFIPLDRSDHSPSLPKRKDTLLPERSYKQIIMSRGVHEYEINGKIYLARNFKNAMRKANNETKPNEWKQ